jgi:hypothetical protein
MLRNPSPVRGEIVVDVHKAFELPPGAKRKYRVSRAWDDEREKAIIQMEAGKPMRLVLEPFEVVVSEAEGVE